MKPETFEGRTMAEVLSQVKQRLGPDAVILNTRTYSRGGVLGRGAEQVVEITAARDAGVLQAAPRAGGRSRTSGGVADQLSSLSAQVAQLNGAVAELLGGARQEGGGSVPEACRSIYQELIQAQVAEELAEDLVRRVHAELHGRDRANPNKIRARLASFVESMLPVAPPPKVRAGGGPVVLSFVGPTGVGKTTTVAKLAANYQLRDGRRVGLVTLDTSRVAAVEQLRIYADIINVPLRVVREPDEMRGALDDLRACDLVLIDTAGRSQNDRAGLEELRDLLEVAEPDEIHLVLASTCARAVIARTMERFAPLGVNRVVLTKLDEAVGFGVVLDCLRSTAIQLSYVTTGRRVPDDIRAGGDVPVTRWIFGGLEELAGTAAAT
jgi:flagellar biosynthesis protein FlhF